MAIGSGKMPVLQAIDGLRLGVVSAGIKTSGRKDLVIFEFVAQASLAAVFTRNAFCAAPVQVAKRHLQTGTRPRYLLINTGNANAGTGQQGIEDAIALCAVLSDVGDVDIEAVLPFSTGVIGEHLPVQKISTAIPAAVKNLRADGWTDAAEGIMTTDTRPKGASCSFEFEGETITITGIAKGAGMIKPNMATMLAYIATDAKISQVLLQSMFAEIVDRSFNRITVDGDTSTNDACILIATGAAGNQEIKTESDPLYLQLAESIETVCLELAQGLVKDAEGASKFVAVTVDGGITEQECLQVAYTIAESPLVKTALFASDPNWGRVLAAIGRAGLKDLEVDLVELYIGKVLIAEKGQRAASYTEQQGQQAMGGAEIDINVGLNRGQCKATVWTSDLSHEYVRINAEYRT